MKNIVFISFILGLFSQITMVYAQTLKVCLDSPVLEPDLHKAIDTSSVEVFHKKIYESLIKYNKKDNGYYTLIAKKITFPSPKSILIDLKKDVTFHSSRIFKPTRNLNADDVIFSFRRQMAKNISDPAERKSFSNFRGRGLDNKFLSIEKIDDYKVLIKTDKKILNIYELLSEHFLSIYSFEYYSKLKKKNKLNFFNRRPIGTGPFIFKKLHKEATYKFTTNKSYHGTKAKFDKLNFYIVTDNVKRTKYTLEGKCHITHNPHWSMLKEIEKNPNLRLEDYLENNMLYLALNLKSRVFKNPEVRKAIALALDYDKYLKSQFYGHAKRANHIITPNFKEYDKTSFALEKNTAKAKKIIGKIYPDGAPTIKLWAITVPRPYIPDGVKLAQMLAQDLRAIGFKVQISKPNFKDFLKKTGNGAHDLAIVGFANITDQQEIMLSLTCDSIKAGSNRSLWCNQKYDQLTNLYFATKSFKTREALLKQIMLLFNSERPRIPIAYMSKKKVISKAIMNFNSANDSSGDYSKILFIENVLKK